MTKPSNKAIRKFVSLMETPGALSYNDENKVFFHRTGQRLAHYLGSRLFPAGTYDVRSNKGGIAVSGEVTLHADHLYLQFSQSMMGPLSILLRTCKSRKDYCGGHNQFCDGHELFDMSAFVDRLQAVFAQGKKLSV